MDHPLPEIKLDDLKSIPAMVDAHRGVITKNALLWYIRERDNNGLAPAVVRVGRNLLISQARFEHWLAKRAGAAMPSRRRAPGACEQIAA